MHSAMARSPAGSQLLVFENVKSRLATLFVIFVVLAGTGTVLGRIATPAWAAMRAKQPALQLNSSIAAAGQGVTLALLGGFRALVGDGAWIRMYALWERRDLAAVD